jgi:uncharacterized protein YhbP (UPF0306 family)
MAGTRQRPSLLNSEPITDDAAEFIRRGNTLALATTAGDLCPRIAPLFYVADSDLRLYWFSKPTSAHGRNLRRNPSAAVTVFRQTDRWPEIQGVQLRGEVRTVRAAERRESILHAFRERFGLGPEFDAALAGHTLYCFTPAWLRWIDNTRGFGYRVERDLAVGSNPKLRA